MLRVNGFYGHVQRNDLRSAAMFLGFLVAFQLVGAVVLTLPLLLLDVAHLPFYSPSAYLARYAPLVLAAGGLLFAIRFLRHVRSVRAAVDFADVDRATEPRLVNIVQIQAIAAGLPLPRVGLIESPARNAFACGLSARSAVVVATRGLVDALDDDELAAVVAHEIAHIRNGDIRLMAAANVLMDNLAAVQRRNLLRVTYKHIVLMVLMPPFLLLLAMAGLVTGAAFTLARVSRLLISSSREFVADAEAVRMTHNPAALISALRRIEGRSAVEGIGARADAMMIDGAVEGAFASHPTIAERIAVLARLSGGMAEVGAPRKDTRPLDVVRREAACGVRNAPAPAAASAPYRPLISRANVGAERDVFGLKAGHRRALALGLAALVALQFWVMAGSGIVLPKLDLRMASAAVREITGGLVNPTWHVPVSEPHRALQRLAETNPVAARCFATDPYQVDDRPRFRPLGPPDLAVVEAYSRDPSGGVPEIRMERYLGLHLKTVRAADAARDGELDAALLEYVRMRKALLQIVHRFYGDAGLRVLQEAYDGSQDRAVLDTLGRRRNERAPALFAKKSVAAEIALLVSSPDSFIPCIARPI